MEDLPNAACACSLSSRFNLAGSTRGGILMALDRSFVEHNRAQTERIRSLAARLSDDDFKRPVGEHWTVAVALAHLAFWDRRVMAVLDASERAGQFEAFDLDVVVNDISLPLWQVIQPHE